MAKKTVELDLALSVDETVELCRTVAKDRRWSIEQVSAATFVAVRPYISGRNKRLSITARFSPSGSGTHVSLTGYIFGLPMPGPHSKAADEWRETLLYESSRMREAS